MAFTWESIVQSIGVEERNVAFFSLEKQGEFYDLLCDDSWESKLAYLVDIFDHLNKTNSSMQGKNENLLSSTDKMRAVQEKLKVVITNAERKL